MVKWYYTCQGLWDQNWSHLVSFGLTKTQNYLKLGSHWAHLRSHWSQSVWAQCEHSLWAHLRSHWAHLRSHCAHTGLMSPVFKSETSFRNFKSWAQCERILTPTGLIWAHKFIFFNKLVSHWSHTGLTLGSTLGSFAFCERSVSAVWDQCETSLLKK